MTDRQFPAWEEFYGTHAGETLPWYHPTLDPDLERALAQHAITGRALDLGTGPGTQAVALAQRGLDVTASDLSVQAIDQARTLAAAGGLKITFVVDDITRSQLAGPFDLVFDRGCFHVLAPEQRTGYARTLARLVAPSGLFFLKCFSDHQPGDQGPYQFGPRDIEEIFKAEFNIVSIGRTIYQGTLASPPKALFCTLRRNLPAADGSA